MRFLPGNRARLPTRAVLIRWGTFFFCLVLLVLRVKARFQYAGIWAEDGQVFLSGVLESGFAAVFQPYAGYWDAAQKLILLAIVRCFPVGTWAVAILSVCTLLYAIFAATITSPRYHWLIPGRKARVATAVFLCLIPGLPEVIGNLANLNWVLFFWMALWALQDPRLRLSRLQISLSFLILWSTGTFVLLLPLFVWRAWYVRARLAPSRGAVGEWTLIVGICVMTLVLAVTARVLGTGPVHLGADPMLSWSTGGLAFLKHFFRLGIFRPWVGSRYASSLSDGMHTDWIGIGLGSAVVLFSARFSRSYRQDPALQAVLTLFLSVSFWPVLCWIGRPGSMIFFLDWCRLTPLWGARYAYPMSVVALLYWMTLLKRHEVSGYRLSRGSWLKSSWVSGTSLFVALNLSHARSGFWLQPYSGSPPKSEQLWRNGAVALEQAWRVSCPKEVRIPISPPGFRVLYRPARDNSEHCETKSSQYPQTHEGS